MEHEWTTGITHYVLTEEGWRSGAPDGVAASELRLHGHFTREILRLAEQVRKLEEARPLTPFERIAADRLADEVASLVSRHLLDSRSAAADALLDYREPPRSPRSDRLAELENDCAEHAEISATCGRSLGDTLERERKLREVLAPVLAVFEERAAAWDRMRAAFDDTGWSGPPTVMDPRITLTAEFEVEALRALIGKE